jgi:hypothetical protein
MMDGKVHADAASHRHAGEGEPLQAGSIRNGEGVVREHLHRVGARRRVGSAVAARVHADHVEVFGQPRHHRVPERAVGAERIGQHQRRRRRMAVASPVDAGAGTVYEGH